MSNPLSIRLSRDRYINLLTDFGFKHLFGTEPNKNLLEERDAYENSLKYYRDMKGVVETAREEGREEGKTQGIQEGKQSLLLKQLSRKLGIIIPNELQVQLHRLDPNLLDTLSEALFDLENIEDLSNWFKSINNR
jgi:predicted transposase YdaD